VRTPGTIVVLNGPSSAGKTSLAQALRPLLPQEWLHVPLDAFRAMKPAGHFRPGQRETNALRLEALCRAINATCRAHSVCGQHVLLDHALPQVGWQYLGEDLAGLPVRAVGVRCALPQREQRELARGDRPVGLTASQENLHAGRRYDFEVDTTERGTAECAHEIARWLCGSK
jgi:chloramphenicol 3-O phosphotransferase